MNIYSNVGWINDATWWNMMTRRHVKPYKHCINHQFWGEPTQYHAPEICRVPLASPPHFPWGLWAHAKKEPRCSTSKTYTASPSGDSSNAANCWGEPIRAQEQGTSATWDSRQKKSPILASWWVSPHGPEIGFSKGWTSVLKPDWSERLWTEASREENFRTRWPGTGRIVPTLILMLNFDFYFIYCILFKFWFLNFQLCMVIFGGVLKACSSFWPHWTCPLNVASGISRHLSMTSRSARVANSFLPPMKPYPSLFQLTW